MKKFETRGWPISFRGPLVIHAGAQWDIRLKDIFRQVNQLLKRERLRLTPEQQKLLYETPIEATLGRCLGFAYLTDCQQMMHGPTPLEHKLGYFGEGRYGFEMSDPQIFRHSIPFRGQQRIWKPGQKALEAVREIEATFPNARS